MTAPKPPVVMVCLHSFEPGGGERVALRLCGALAPMLDLRLVRGRTSGVMASQAPAGVPLQVTGSGPISTAAWETLWLIIVLARRIRQQRLDGLFAALGLGGRITLPGNGDAPQGLAAADVFLLSSDQDALPAAVVETLASGPPVVATDCCVSMRNLVGSFGFVVAPGDTSALAQALRAQPLPDAAKRAAAATAMQRVTIGQAAADYASLFQQLAKSTRLRRSSWPQSRSS
jgi:glycosyltransferase involved in cell wall biosynthesis